MGVIDHMRIPKAVFYLFRKFWTGVSDTGSDGVPVPKITPTHLQLNADTGTLVADSTDVSIITASLRAANGLCVDNTDGGDKRRYHSRHLYRQRSGECFRHQPLQALCGKMRDNDQIDQYAGSDHGFRDGRRIYGGIDHAAKRCPGHQFTAFPDAGIATP